MTMPKFGTHGGSYGKCEGCDMYGFLYTAPSPAQGFCSSCERFVEKNSKELHGALSPAQIFENIRGLNKTVEVLRKRQGRIHET